MALFACVAYTVSSILYAKDSKDAKFRKALNKELLIKLKPDMYRTQLHYAQSLRSGASGGGSGFL